MLETTEQTAKVVETTRSYRNLAEYNLFGYNLQVGSIEVKKLAGGSLQDVSGKNFEVLDEQFICRIAWKYVIILINCLTLSKNHY